MSKSYCIIGENGQLAKELQSYYPEARVVGSSMLDITDKAAVEAFDWSDIEVILNAAAYTNVDGAETQQGRIAAWKLNADGVKNLCHVARKNDAILVHISSDYVFDGTKSPHAETEELSPLSSYGASKAAGDLLTAQLEKQYVLRTTWVVGDGKNFVRTMLGLAEKGVSPTVVNDQIGRLTFTSEIVRAIDHLLTTQAAFGTYNVSNGGESVSWADITRSIFELSGHTELTVTGISTTKYFAGKEGIAPRPLQSELSLTKLQATGFEGRDWQDVLKEYIDKETQL